MVVFSGRGKSPQIRTTLKPDRIYGVQLDHLTTVVIKHTVTLSPWIGEMKPWTQQSKEVNSGKYCIICPNTFISLLRLQPWKMAWVSPENFRNTSWLSRNLPLCVDIVAYIETKTVSFLGLEEKSGVSKCSAPGRSIWYYSRMVIQAKDAEPDERQNKKRCFFKIHDDMAARAERGTLTTLPCYPLRLFLKSFQTCSHNTSESPNELQSTSVLSWLNSLK